MTTKNKALLEDLGLLVDKAENYMALSELALPPFTEIDGLRQGVVELRDELRKLYEKQGGSCEETWTLGPYGNQK